MRYTDGSIVKTRQELQDLLNVSFFEGFPPDGWVQYEEPIIPYVLTWDDIRANRNEKLRECDWTQLADVDLTTVESIAWIEYRQALRDIPQVFSTPEDVIFPEVP